MKRIRTHIKTGFTLVEILAVMVVIAILLGLLIPALSSVEQKARTVKQKAQFHSIGVALEAFYNDATDYPPSEWDASTYGNYTASQRLAEALVGRDGFGFHSDSIWNESGEDAAGNPLYMDHTNYDTYYNTAGNPTVDDNMAGRYGPYLELENANAVKLEDLYGSLGGDPVNSYILADMYKITKNRATGKTTGSPILYYRANRNKIHHYSTKGAENVYNVYDSIGSASGSGYGIARLTPLVSSATAHPMRSNLDLFYDQTTNPNFPGDASYDGTAGSGTPPRPYRAESFILQSAGPDGLYGNQDDVFNFEQEE